MSGIKEVLDLVEKHYPLSVNIGSLHKLVAINKKETNSFEKFLISARLMPFIKLKILADYFLDKEFIIAYFESKYYNFVHDEGPAISENEIDRISIGPTFLKKKFSGQEIFDHVVKKEMGFRVIDTSNAPLLTGLQRFYKEGEVVDKLGRNTEHHENESYICISKDDFIIFTETEIYVKKKSETLEKVKAIIEFHKPIFEKFLDKYKESAVPHEMYVNWLTGWFKGMIKLNTLE